MSILEFIIFVIIASLLIVDIVFIALVQDIELIVISVIILGLIIAGIGFIALIAGWCSG